MAGKSFLATLSAIVFVVLGIAMVLSTLQYLSAGEVQVEVLATLFSGLLYIMAGYGLYKGYKWGWMLAMILVVLNLLGIIYLWMQGREIVYLSLLINAVLFLLLLVVSKEYGVFIGKPSRPSTPAPPPSAPISAVASVEPVERRNIYVKRKYDY